MALRILLSFVATSAHWRWRRKSSSLSSSCSVVVSLFLRAEQMSEMKRSAERLESNRNADMVIKFYGA